MIYFPAKNISGALLTFYILINSQTAFGIAQCSRVLIELEGKETLNHHDDLIFNESPKRIITYSKNSKDWVEANSTQLIEAFRLIRKAENFRDKQCKGKRGARESLPKEWESNGIRVSLFQSRFFKVVIGEKVLFVKPKKLSYLNQWHNGVDEFISAHRARNLIETAPANLQELKFYEPIFAYESKITGRKYIASSFIDLQILATHEENIDLPEHREILKVSDELLAYLNAHEKADGTGMEYGDMGSANILYDPSSGQATLIDVNRFPDRSDCN
ncbi:MAG: hypothetical protein IPJ71_05940 [Bdellovibrionales bacterium]|nr:hypothetical protein [Bdellovibrionales bacterium]